MSAPQEEDEVEGIDCSPCCRNDKFRFTMVSLLLGQVLSLCLCGTGVTSQYLSSIYHVDTPTTQSFLNYFFLCLVYGTVLACRPSESGLVQVFRHHWWKYALLAFVDVEANYLLVRAYQYTNLASIQLLDCFTIPVVLMLSFIFLSVRYLLPHIIGVAICLLGIGCLVWGDILMGKGSGGSDKLIGDVLCLSGAAIYGVANVVEEVLVKKFSRIEYLGMVGLFGSVISGIQLSLFERSNLSAVPWSNYRVILLYLGFALFMFTFYSLVTLVMQRSSATMFNLSILSADFYSLIIGIAVFDYTFHVLYFVSFALVVFGSILYAWKDTETRRPSTDEHSSLLMRIMGRRSNQRRPVGGAAFAADAEDGDDSTTLATTNFVSLDAAGFPILDANANDGNMIIKVCPVHGTVMIPKSPASTLTRSPPPPPHSDAIVADGVSPAATNRTTT